MLIQSEWEKWLRSLDADVLKANPRINFARPSTFVPLMWETALAAWPAFDQLIAIYHGNDPKRQHRGGELSNEALMAQLRYSIEHPDGD